MLTLEWKLREGRARTQISKISPNLPLSPDASITDLPTLIAEPDKLSDNNKTRDAGQEALPGGMRDSNGGSTGTSLHCILHRSPSLTNNLGQLHLGQFTFKHFPFVRYCQKYFAHINSFNSQLLPLSPLYRGNKLGCVMNTFSKRRMGVQSHIEFVFLVTWLSYPRRLVR